MQVEFGAAATGLEHELLPHHNIYTNERDSEESRIRVVRNLFGLGR
jgi:hypothetical protein